MLNTIDRFIELVLRAVRWLALPIALLLFLQWPLRDIVKAYSREANDLGQWMFALFVAASVVAATRANAHLASDTVARRYSSSTRGWLAIIGCIVALLPWALFIGVQGWPQIAASILGLERFPDTANPAYFVIKAALLLMIGLIVLQAGVDVGRWLKRQSDPS